LGSLAERYIGFMANEMFVALQVLVIAMLFIFPEIVAYLPSVIY